MSIQLCRRAQVPVARLAELEKAMAEFYSHPPANYYQIADQAAQKYTPNAQPFHCDLVDRVSSGTHVLEVGCGTAHLCHYVENRGGHYTGMDYSVELLEGNRKRFPNAEFFQIGTPPKRTFDIVASLYAIEHVTDPPKYLESLWHYCHPGGLVGIICPEFVENQGFAPGVYYGKTPRRFREKLQTFSFIDAICHVIDLKIHASRWKKAALASPPGAFWINLRPRALKGTGFSCDEDAVHMARLKDLVWFFQNRGAEIVTTSAQMPNVSPEVLRYNLYLLARKPLNSKDI